VFFIVVLIVFAPVRDDVEEVKRCRTW